MLNDPISRLVTRTPLLLGLTACLTVAGASDVRADYVTSFEASEGYTLGETFIGIDGWTKVAGSQAYNSATQIVDTPVSHGSQAAVVARHPEASNANNGYAEKVFDAVTGTVTISFDVAGSPSASVGGMVIAFGQAGTAGADATTGLSAFNIAFSTTTDIRYGSTSNVTLHDAYVAGAYYSVTAVVDLDAQLWSLTVAGPGLDDPFVASGLALRDNGITQIDWVSIRALNHGTAIYVDNLAVVPEPASASLALLGGLFAAGRRRRREAV